MTSNKNRILPLSLLVLVLVGVVYYAYRKERSFRITDSDNDAVATSTKTIEIAPGIFAEVEGNATPTITVVPVEDSLPMPNLEGPVVIPTAMDAQAGQRIVDHIKSLTVSLRADPSSYNTWNDLGIYRKMLNDYKGAEEIISRKNDHSKIELHLPKDSLIRAEQKDENLVGEILTDLQAQYSPLPPISGLEIAI